MRRHHLTHQSPPFSPFLQRGLLGLLASLVGACGGTGTEVSPAGSIPGTNPATGARFFEDPNQEGEGEAFTLDEMYWGRLVDVYAFALEPVEESELATLDPARLVTLDAEDCTDDPANPTACLRKLVSRLQFADFIIGQGTVTDGVNYELTSNSVTQEVRLTIPHPDTAELSPLTAVNDPDDEDDMFSRLLRVAANGVTSIPRVGLLEAGPFPLVARNAAVGMRFSDLLDESTIRASTIKVRVGNPPEVPFEARIVPDQNFGDVVNGTFYPTRVIVDMTVSELESAALGLSVPPNSLGLPISQDQARSNLAFEFPTQLDPTGGTFRRLQNVSGSGLATQSNGEVDTTSPTTDVRRAMRSGNSEDLNNGFLLDLLPPRVVGSQPVRITPQEAEVCDETTERFNFVVNMDFDYVACARSPRAGDVISLPVGLFEVSEDGLPPTGGTVFSIPVRFLGENPVCAFTLNDEGTYLSLYDPLNNDVPECFVTFSPTPKAPPNNLVNPDLEISVRFSEPINLRSVDPFESFLVARTSTDPVPNEVVVGSISPSADLQRFAFKPSLDLAHDLGNAEEYFFTLGSDELGVVDLAGNGLRDGLPQVSFTVDNEALTRRTGGYSLRFNSIDEDRNGDSSSTRPEVRGQFLFDFENAAIRPRPVSRFRAVADRSQPVPGNMVPFPSGVQTPLSPAGSKLMTLWRYFDVGFSLRDETNYNVDVEGLNWAPVNGALQSDFYERFSISMAHSGRTPDEFINPLSLLPDCAQSGLKTETFQIAGVNRLDDVLNPETVMVPKERGYSFSPSDAFVSPTGTVMVPYSINNPHLQVAPSEDPIADYTTYTWRDTSVTSVDGRESGGIHPKIFGSLGLLPAGGAPGAPYAPGNVPSIALPLLIQYSCFPSDEGSGLNSFDISLALNSSAQPYFRVFSTGGTNSQGQSVEVDPESALHDTPRGGFNPSMGGTITPAGDNSFYIGALDVVIRVSRAHTIWFGEADSPLDFSAPIVFPRASLQPFGTSIELAFRGAESITDNLMLGSADASTFSPYGESAPTVTPEGAPIIPFTVIYQGGTQTEEGDASWKSSIDAIDGTSYVQCRITFVSNVQSDESPVLSALGIPFTRL